MPMQAATRKCRVFQVLKVGLARFNDMSEQMCSCWKCGGKKGKLMRGASSHGPFCVGTE